MADIGVTLTEQFSYNIPDDFVDYLFGGKGLQTFKFYPLVVTVLFIVLAVMVGSFLYAKIKRNNRPLAKYSMVVGKTFVWEFLLGSFAIFSRWQTLGVFALRVFLLGWLVSLPICAIVLAVVYFKRHKADVQNESKKEDLDKYKPS